MTKKKNGPDSTVESRVKEIIVENLGCGEEELTGNASFADDLGADSLDAVEVIMSIEEEYGLEIPDEIAEEIRTVQQLVDYVKKARGITWKKG